MAQKSSTSISKIVFRFLKSSTKTQALIASSIAMTVLSCWIQIIGTRKFSEIVNQRKAGSLDKAYALFVTAAICCILNRIFTNTRYSLTIFCGIIVEKLFLHESVFQVLDMEFVKFHSKISANIQDDATKSAKAARRFIPFFLINLPSGIFMSLLYVYELWNILDTSVFQIVVLFLAAYIVLSFKISAVLGIDDEKIKKLFDKSLGPLADILKNFDTIKAYNKEKRELSIYKKKLNPYVQTGILVEVKIFFLWTFSELVFMIPYIYVFYKLATGEKVLKNSDSDLLRFHHTFYSFWESSYSLSVSLYSLFRYSAEIDKELTFAKTESVDSRLISKETFDDSIELSGADLYAGDSLIQKGIGFKIGKNEKVAITGMNGAGKTVFAKTLLKFFKSRGNLSIDGTPIEQISTKSLRNLISYVPQEPHIFNSTVLYNLGYSKDEPFDEQLIYEYCAQFGQHEFFKALRDGYQTEAGEQGKYLSGGQKQRINLMRAMIKDAPIVIMDEPTANIDKETEFDLIEKVITNCGDKTFLMIVHNRELLRKFGKILYFTKSGVTVFESYEDYLSMNQS